MQRSRLRRVVLRPLRFGSPKRLRARSAARLLLALRLFPAAIALAAVAGLCVPSYLSLEEEGGAEFVGLHLSHRSHFWRRGLDGFVGAQSARGGPFAPLCPPMQALRFCLDRRWNRAVSRHSRHRAPQADRFALGRGRS